jgi:hypothetical protein
MRIRMRNRMALRQLALALLCVVLFAARIVSVFARQFLKFISSPRASSLADIRNVYIAENRVP